MQQVRTHRVGVSFDVQSFRYTGNRISQVSNHEVDVEDVFYLRPVGFYTDRFGKKYEYTEEMRIQDLSHCLHAADLYEKRIQQGVSEEHARSIIPFDTRQHFVVSMNLRTAFHLLDMRYKSDAQLECQAWAHLLWLRIKEWVPEIAAWYEEKRLNRGRLAP
jgi:thymidylate synthase (FAD)